MLSRVSWLVLVVSCMPLISCDDIPPTNPLNVNVTIAGSSFPKAVMHKWIQNYTQSIAFYEEFAGNVTYIALEGDNSMPYITSQIAHPTWSFLEVDNHINDTIRYQLMASMNGGLVQMPMLMSGVSIIYNLTEVDGFPAKALNLTADLVSRIFTGNITKWNDSAILAVNPDVPALAHHDANITVVVRSESPASTTHDLTHDFLVPFNASHWNASGVQDGPDQFVRTARQVKGGRNMTTTITTTRNSIGYSKKKTAEIGDLAQWSAALQNVARQFVQPTTENILAAADPKTITFPNANSSWAQFHLGQSNATNAYPASALAYFLISTNLTYMNDPQSSDAVNDFLEWYNSHDHARVDLEVGFVPINDFLREQNLAALKLITWAPFPIGPNAQTFKMVGTGSSFVNQLLTTWMNKISARKVWRDKYAGVITYSSNGDDSSSAIYNQSTFSIPPFSFIEIDTHITDDIRRGLVKNLNGKVLQLPIILSAVSIVYNLTDAGLVSPLNLTADVAAQIFMGNITMWNATPLTHINPQLVNYNHTIKVFVRNESAASTTHDLTHDFFVPFQASAWHADGVQDGPDQFPDSAKRVQGGKAMTEAIKNTPNSIGYSKKKTAEQAGLASSSAALLNREKKFVLPTSDNVIAAANNPHPRLPTADESWADFRLGQSRHPDAYPASAIACFLVAQNLGYLDRGTREALKEFLVWINQHDQAKAELPMGFVPLVKSIRSQNLNALEKLNLDAPSFFNTPSDERNAVVIVLVLLFIILGVSLCYVCCKYNLVSRCWDIMTKQEKRIKLTNRNNDVEGHGMLSASKDNYEPSLTLDEHDMCLEELSYNEHSRKRMENGAAVEVEIPETEDDR